MKNCTVSFVKKLCLTVAVIGFSIPCNAQLETQLDAKFVDITTRPEFNAVDQKNGQFIVSGKPLLLTFYPQFNELNELTCKIENITPTDTLVDDNAEQKTVTPIRLTTKLVNINKKIDRVYPGYRETRLEKGVEKALRFIKLYPELTHPGTPLVDEYLEGMPMKLAFTNIKDFKTVKNYLEKKFSEEDFKQKLAAKTSKPGYLRPILLIEFTETDTYMDLTNEDIDFLTTYYALLNPFDKNVKFFFNELQKIIDDAREHTATAKHIQESIGEQIIRVSEDSFGGTIKAQDIIVKVAIVGIISGIVLGISKRISDRITNRII